MLRMPPQIKPTTATTRTAQFRRVREWFTMRSQSNRIDIFQIERTNSPTSVTANPTYTVAFTFALAARRSLLRAWRGFLVVSPARYRLSATTRIARHATRRTRTHFLANAVLDEELQVVSRGLRGDLRT